MDRERREEELQALEAIYGDAFTLGIIISFSDSNIKVIKNMSFETHYLCVIMQTAQAPYFQCQELKNNFLKLVLISFFKILRRHAA